MFCALLLYQRLLLIFFMFVNKQVLILAIRILLKIYQWLHECLVEKNFIEPQLINFIL